MRTTLDLPEELVKQVQELSGAPTKKQAIAEALEEYVKSRLRKRLIDRLGTMKLSVTQDDIDEWRKDREPPGPNDPLMLLVPQKDQGEEPPSE